MAMEKIHDKQSMERTLKNAGSKPVVFAFISYKCGHCKIFLPFLEFLCQEMPDVIFLIVDVNTSEDLMRNFEVESVPHIFIYKNGVLCKQILGANKELLVDTLKELRN